MLGSNEKKSDHGVSFLATVLFWQSKTLALSSDLSVAAKNLLRPGKLPGPVMSIVLNRSLGGLGRRVIDPDMRGL